MKPKRTFIRVKRGILEPKHRHNLGGAIFLYLYMLDIVNWEDGIIHEWIDQAAADELEMPLPTVRSQRRQLEDNLYIRTTQHKRYLEIEILKWESPIKGDNKGDSLLSPLTSKGDNKGDNKGNQILTRLHRVSDYQTIRLKEEEESDDPEPEFVPLSVSDPELAVYVGVTGFVAMPSGYTKSNDNARATIRALLKKHGGVNGAVDYLRPFWVEYRKRKLPAAQYYWLDWAITGEIPPEYAAKPFYKGKPPVKEVDILDPAVYRDKYLKYDEEVD